KVDGELGDGEPPLREGAAPGFRCVSKCEIEQLQSGVLIGEGATCFGHLAELSVERLDGVGRIDSTAHFRREAKEGDNFFPALRPCGSNHRIATVPLIIEL